MKRQEQESKEAQARNRAENEKQQMEEGRKRFERDMEFMKKLEEEERKRRGCKG